MSKNTQGLIRDYLSPVTSLINTFRKYLADHLFITDLVTKLVITFGVVLIMGGLYLMLTQGSMPSQGAQAYSAVQTVVSAIAWVPGIPFYIGELTGAGFSIIGLISWIVGLDLILIGLGLWVRHVLARYTALVIFVLAACFQFAQFVQVGIMGSPGSVASLLVDLIIAYFLFSKFDQPRSVENKLATSSQLSDSQVSTQKDSRLLRTQKQLV